MPILKNKTPVVRWPFILEEPTDDVSFNPFDLDGCRQALLGGCGIIFVVFVICAAGVGLGYLLGVYP